MTIEFRIQSKAHTVWYTDTEYSRGSLPAAFALLESCLERGLVYEPVRIVQRTEEVVYEKPK